MWSRILFRIYVDVIHLTIYWCERWFKLKRKLATQQITNVFGNINQHQVKKKKKMSVHSIPHVGTLCKHSIPHVGT